MARHLAPKALVATTLLALALGACGDDDSDDAGERTGTTSTVSTGRPQATGARRDGGAYRPAPATPEGRTVKTVTRVYDVLDAPPAAARTSDFCALMTAEARRQTIRYVRVASGRDEPVSCADAVAFMIRRSKRVGRLDDARRVEVIGVNVVGDRASASVRFGNGPVTSLPLKREAGQWKLASNPTGGR